MWAVYAATINMTFLMLSNISCSTASIVALIFGTKANWPLKYIVSSIFGTVGAAILALTAANLAVALLTLGAVLFTIPQLIKIVQVEKLSGLSVTTWWLTIAVSGSWLMVAVYEKENGVIITNTVSIIVLLGVIGAIYVRKNILNNALNTKI